MDRFWKRQFCSKAINCSQSNQLERLDLVQREDPEVLHVFLDGSAMASRRGIFWSKEVSLVTLSVPSAILAMKVVPTFSLITALRRTLGPPLQLSLMPMVMVEMGDKFFRCSFRQLCLLDCGRVCSFWALSLNFYLACLEKEELALTWVEFVLGICPPLYHQESSSKILLS